MLASNLVDRCDLLGQARDVRDSFGAVDREPREVLAAGLRCLVRPLSSKAQARDGRGETTATHVVYFNAPHPFGRSAVLRITHVGGRELARPRVLEITGVIDNLGRGTDVHVEALEVLDESPS